jgi:hypothetical protein
VVVAGGGKTFVKSRVVVGVGVGGPVWGWGWGPGWGWGWGPGWWGPGWWGPPAGVVVQGAAPVTWIEQGGGQAPPDAAAPTQWWYFCSNANAYYPYVRECPGGWQRVSPHPPSAPN